MNKTKKCNSVIFSNLKTKRGSGWTGMTVSVRFGVLERERVCILFRFSADRTVGSRRSKK